MQTLRKVVSMWTLQDAKNRFSAVVDAALAGVPQEVTRRGKSAVVVLSVPEYHRLLAESVRHCAAFKDHLLAFPEENEIPRAEVAPREVQF